MKIMIKIDPKQRKAYMPKKLLEAGFVEDVPMIVNASTAVLLHPKARPEEIIRSLKMIIEDVAIRQRLLKNVEDEKKEKTEEQIE